MTTVTLFNVVQISRPSWCRNEVWKATCISGCNYAAVSHMHFPSCRVWNITDGSLLNTLDHCHAVLSLRFNSNTLVTGSAVLCIFVPTYMYPSNQRLDFNSLLPSISTVRCQIGNNPQQISRVRVPLGRVVII